MIQRVDDPREAFILIGREWYLDRLIHMWSPGNPKDRVWFSLQRSPANRWFMNGKLHLTTEPYDTISLGMDEEHAREAFRTVITGMLCDIRGTAWEAILVETDNIDDILTLLNQHPDYVEANLPYYQS